MDLTQERIYREKHEKSKRKIVRKISRKLLEHFLLVFSCFSL
jgi:hypothetical protein